mgnify:CR=1 FL=1
MGPGEVQVDVGQTEFALRFRKTTLLPRNLGLGASGGAAYRIMDVDLPLGAQSLHYRVRSLGPTMGLALTFTPVFWLQGHLGAVTSFALFDVRHDNKSSAFRMEAKAGLGRSAVLEGGWRT